MTKGFTLIELLVVVAIVGIFAAIALVSLSASRNKGNDAAVKSNLQAVRTQVELYFSNNNYSYTAAGTSPGNCTTGTSALFSDANISKQLSAIENANGSGIGLVCRNTPTAYAVQSSLTGGGYWCIDSVGFMGARTQPLATTQCPNS